MITGIIPRLATFDAASLPAGSGERLADILVYCQTMIEMLPDGATKATGTITGHRVAHRPLTNALTALGMLHRYRRNGPMPSLHAEWQPVAEAVMTAVS
jgi:hypothetical protein